MSGKKNQETAAASAEQGTEELNRSERPAASAAPDNPEGAGEGDGDGDGVTQDELEKSLARLDELASAGDAPTRKEQLLEKAKGKEGLDKSETSELFKLLGGEPREEIPLADKVIESLETEPIQKSLDVSDYLEEQHGGLVKSMGMLADHVEASDNRQHQFNLLFAKAMSEIGKLVKSANTNAESIIERLGGIEQQPARAPKARRSTQEPAQPLAKSFGNGEGADEGLGLSKAEIAGEITTMLQKSMEAGTGGVSPSGHDLTVAGTNFEMFSEIAPTLLEEVKASVQSRKATAH